MTENHISRADYGTLEGEDCEEITMEITISMEEPTTTEDRLYRFASCIGGIWIGRSICSSLFSSLGLTHKKEKEATKLKVTTRNFLCLLGSVGLSTLVAGSLSKRMILPWVTAVTQRDVGTTFGAGVVCGFFTSSLAHMYDLYRHYIQNRYLLEWDQFRDEE